VTVINSTFVIRFKSSKTRQKTASQAATIHSANVVCKCIKHSKHISQTSTKTWI